MIGSQKGFSLLEAMVAFGILAIGMAGVATMLIMSMRSDQYSAELRDGEQVAMRVVEQLKADASREDTDIARFGSWIGSDLYTRTGSLLGYSYLMSLTTNYPYSGLDRLDIQVGWGGENCTKDTFGDCKYTTRVINFIVPYAPHTRD
jgi:Tfp pilus assembly protein PilV